MGVARASPERPTHDRSGLFPGDGEGAPGNGLSGPSAIMADETASSSAPAVWREWPSSPIRSVRAASIYREDQYLKGRTVSTGKKR